MRIGLFYKHYKSDGGLPKDFRRLASELTLLGNKVFVYTSKGEECLIDIDSKCIVREYEFRKRSSFFVPKSLIRLLSGNEDNLDILEVVGGFFPENITICRVARKSGIPYVYAPLGHLVPNVINHKNTLAKKLFMNLFLRKAMSCAKALHCFSEFDKNYAMKLVIKPVIMTGLGIFDEEIPSFIKKGFFLENIPSFSGKDIFIFFGRLDYYNKGIDVFIKALAMIGDKINNVGFVIVGPGTKKEIWKIRNKIQKFGLNNYIEVIPPIFDSGKFSLLYDADFFILPSRMDNWPRAVREALAVGCPVLVSEQTGTADIVMKYGAGLVITTDPKKLASTIMDLLGKKDQWLNMRIGALRAAKESLTWTKQAENLEKGFRNIVRTDN